VSRYYEGVELAEMERRFRHGYLTRTGWLRSAELKESVDNAGPVPWYSYAAIEALKTLIRPDMRVFEYGAGNSTVWWSKRTAQVVAVDQDPQWVRSIRDAIRPTDRVDCVEKGAECSQERLSVLTEFVTNEIPGELWGAPDRQGPFSLADNAFAAYAAVLLGYPRHTFDIVCVDGAARGLTAWVAGRAVRPDGFIVFDNAERKQYEAGYRALRAAGFVRIDFTSPGPINPYSWTTSVWTRSIGIFSADHGR